MKKKLFKNFVSILMTVAISSAPVFAQDNIIVSMNKDQVLVEDKVQDIVS